MYTERDSIIEETTEGVKTVRRECAKATRSGFYETCGSSGQVTEHNGGPETRDKDVRDLISGIWGRQDGVGCAERESSEDVESGTNVPLEPGCTHL